MKVPIVQAKTDRNKVPDGNEFKVYVLCNDNLTYRVKFFQIDEKPYRGTLNELIGFMFAHFTGCDTPKFSLIEFPNDLLAFIKDKYGKPRINGSLHFGVEDIRNGENLFFWLNDSSKRKSLCNPENVPGIYLVDFLILNCDRGNNNPYNYLFQRIWQGEDVVLKYLASDFAQAFFSPYWKPIELTSKLIYYREPVYSPTELEDKYVKDFHSFHSFLEYIINISDKELGELINCIPVSWQMDQDSKNALRQCLKLRADNVKEFLMGHKDLFPLWSKSLF